MVPDVVHGDPMCFSCRGVNINVHAECVIICCGHIFKMMRVYVTSSFFLLLCKTQSSALPSDVSVFFSFSRRSPE